MKGRFRLTPEAKADLREILLVIAEDSPELPNASDRNFTERCDGWGSGRALVIIMRNSWIADIASGTSTYMWSATFGRRSPFTLSPWFTGRANSLRS